MASSLTPCDVSQCLGEDVSICHRTFYTTKQGFISVDELPQAEKVLLMHRIGIQPDMGVNPSSICYHHKIVFLDYFETLERTCCDPWNVHKKSCRKSLRSIDMDMAIFLSSQSNKKIKAGQKLCPSCRKQVLSQQGKPKFLAVYRITEIIIYIVYYLFMWRTFQYFGNYQILMHLILIHFFKLLVKS